MKKYLHLVLLLSLMFSSVAQSYDCTGKVNNIVVAPNGVLTLSFGNISWVYLCSMTAPHNGVSVEACKAMLGVLLAAKMGDRNIVMWFDDQSNNCTNASHPAWADLKNWYYGPAIQ
jgi:hypothetical protein